MKLSLYSLKLLIIDFILFARAKNFDILPPGWLLAWENVTLSDNIDSSQCALACEVTSRCVGGRFEKSPGRCHLSIRSDQRQLSMYEKNSSGTDRVFGVACDSKSGFSVRLGHSIWGYNIKTYAGPISVEKCAEYCVKNSWCRSFEIRKSDKKCYLQSLGDSHLIADTAGYDMRIRNC